MDTSIVNKLINLNNNFYEQIAADFNATRSSSWDGWHDLVGYFRACNFKPGSVLDLGCGNGRFLKFARENFQLQRYLGLDSSQKLLAYAKEANTTEDHSAAISYSRHDLFKNPDLKFLHEKFELIVLLGIMHHVPGKELRTKILTAAGKQLVPGGKLVVTFWDFQSEQKLSKKVVPWEFAGLNVKELEANDYLLDWKRGQTAYRYCHFYTADEINELTSSSGLTILKIFQADGPGGKANTYVVFSSEE